jgi:hypothetical protein
MSTTGGRRARAARSGTPTAVGFAALVATLLLAACSGDASPSEPSESTPAEPSQATPSADGDPRQAKIAALLRRIDLSFDDPSSYRFTTRATGTYPATIRGEGSLREVIVRQTSSWRRPVVDGVDRYNFVVNDATNAYLGAGLPPDASPRLVPVSSAVVDLLEAIHGPGANTFVLWKYRVNEVADEMSDIDLDPDGTGDKVAFTLPTRVWMPPQEALPPGIDATTDYELTFDGEDLVRIEALRDDTIITTRIEHGPYRRIALPGVARQGP